MVLGKKWSGILLALLAVVALAMLLAAPAWSQDERTKRDGEQGKKVASATERARDATTKERASGSERTREATFQRDRARSERDSERAGTARAEQDSQKVGAQATNDPVENRQVFVDESGGIVPLEVDQGDVLLIPGNFRLTCANPTVIIEDQSVSPNEQGEFIDGDNANISIVQGGDLEITVTDAPVDPDDNTLPVTLFTEDLVGVESTCIQRANNNNNNNNRNDNRNRFRNDRLDNLLDRFLFDEQYNDGNVLDEFTDDLNESTTDDLTDDTEDSDTLDETTDDTGTDTATDTLDESSEPFTDPDTQTPADNPVGETLNEIPDRSTPLPETGGSLLLALALPLGVTLVVAGFAVLRFGQRRRR